MGRRPVLNLVAPLARHGKTQPQDIFAQLQAEEALFRNAPKESNWCLLNWSHSRPTVVLGLSGRPEVLVHEELASRDDVPLLRRFTGGGTVVVARGTLFMTFILNSKSVPQVRPFPRPIMEWTGDLYNRVFAPLTSRSGTSITLRENDYVVNGDVKVGGNAQAISGDKWLHHTSFLWDMDLDLMKYLKHPQKVPEYRQDRDHKSFVCNLSSILDPMPSSTSSKPSLEDQFNDALRMVLEEEFEIQTKTWDDVEEFVALPHRKSTTWVVEPRNDDSNDIS